jgi:hypothetical protein
LDDGFAKVFPYVFPFLFAGMWLFVTTILAVKAGWYDLARKYPNRDEKPILRTLFQSGRMSSVSMSSILRLEVCASGLRIGIWKLFGPFSRDFLVPWNEIHVERKNGILWGTAKLTFGGGPQDLVLMDYLANRLARSVPGRWPETGSFAKDTLGQAVWSTFKVWGVGMAFVGAFFTFVPWIFSGKPVTEMYVPCAILTGIAAVVMFLQRIRN